MDLEKKKKFIPKIFILNGDLSKRWYVSYYVNDPGANFKRCRYYGDINKFKTFNARMLEASKVLSIILETGHPPAPRTGKKNLHYSDNNKNSGLNSALDQFLDDKRPYLRKKTIQGYISKLSTFKRWLLKVGLQDFKPCEISLSIAGRFISSLDLSNNSKNGYLLLLSMAWDSFIKNGTAEKNHFRGIPKFSRLSIPAAAFEDKQVKQLEKILKISNPQLWLFCLLQYYTFIRPNELRNLKIENIYLETNKIQIPAKVSKNKKTEFVAIPAQLKRILERLDLFQFPAGFYLFSSGGTCGPNKLGINTMSNRFRIIIRGLNYSSRYKLYSWKHTGAAACALAGVPIKQLQLQLRHHSLDQVDQYLRSLGVIDLKNIRENFPSI